jgi:hypothetical protein
MAKRRKKTRRRSAAEREFISGKQDKLELELPLKTRLGFSPAQATASGAGTHGGSRRQQLRRARQAQRRQLRGGDWE